MRKHLANLLTGTRILGSVWMLCTPVFSPSFYGAYLICGLTDMVDGTVARKTNSVTKFGEQLDSAADLVFAAAAFVKLVPAVALPLWLWGWIVILAVIRSGTIVRNLVCEKRFGLNHTVMNKAVGVLLFLLPLSMPFIELRYGAAAVWCCGGLCSGNGSGPTGRIWPPCNITKGVCQRWKTLHIFCVSGERNPPRPLP